MKIASLEECGGAVHFSNTVTKGPERLMTLYPSVCPFTHSVLERMFVEHLLGSLLCARHQGHCVGQDSVVPALQELTVHEGTRPSTLAGTALWEELRECRGHRNLPKRPLTAECTRRSSETKPGSPISWFPAPCIQLPWGCDLLLANCNILIRHL